MAWHPFVRSAGAHVQLLCQHARSHGPIHLYVYPPSSTAPSLLIIPPSTFPGFKSAAALGACPRHFALSLCPLRAYWFLLVPSSSLYMPLRCSVNTRTDVVQPIHAEVGAPSRALRLTSCANLSSHCRSGPTSRDPVVHTYVPITFQCATLKQSEHVKQNSLSLSFRSHVSLPCMWSGCI